MLFTLPPNMARMSLGGDPALPDALARGQGRPRIGRGGRLIFDRVHALTHEELSGSVQNDDGVRALSHALIQDESVLPLSEMC